MLLGVRVAARAQRMSAALCAQAAHRLQDGRAGAVRSNATFGHHDQSKQEKRDAFLQLGLVEDAVVMMDHHSKRSRGFGFVSFADDATADLVISLDSRPVIFGKAVEIKRAVPREQLQLDALAHTRRASLGPYMQPGYPASPYALPFGAPSPQPVYGGYPPQMPGLSQYSALEHELPAVAQSLYAMDPMSGYPPRGGMVPQEWQQWPYDSGPALTPGPHGGPARFHGRGTGSGGGTGTGAGANALAGMRPTLAPGALDAPSHQPLQMRPGPTSQPMPGPAPGGGGGMSSSAAAHQPVHWPVPVDRAGPAHADRRPQGTEGAGTSLDGDAFDNLASTLSSALPHMPATQRVSSQIPAAQHPGNW